MYRFAVEDFDVSDLMVWIIVNGFRMVLFVAATLAIHWFAGHVRYRIQKAWRA